MPSYRFCRPDTIPLLVRALNVCYRPHFPGEEEFTVERFRRAMKELDVWPSNSMVALEGEEPIAVVVGTKREHEVLIHWLGVAPGRERQGHGSHLVMSLSHKLAVLGPPKLAAEVPEDNVAASALFESLGFEDVATLTDWFLPAGAESPVTSLLSSVTSPQSPVTSLQSPVTSLQSPGSRSAEGNRGGETGAAADLESVDAAELLEQLQPAVSWLRSPQTVRQAADRLQGWRGEGGWVLLDADMWPARVYAMEGEAPFPLLHSLAQRVEYGLLVPSIAEEERSSEQFEAEGFMPLRRYHRVVASAVPA